MEVIILSILCFFFFPVVHGDFGGGNGESSDVDGSDGAAVDTDDDGMVGDRLGDAIGAMDGAFSDTG